MSICEAQLAEFDEYQQELPERMLRRSFEGQVNSMAAGLSVETRAILVDVLVEEALLADQSPPPEDATAGFPLVQRMNVYADAGARSSRDRTARISGLADSYVAESKNHMRDPRHEFEPTPGF